jgi:hypothetical protein
VCNWVGITCHRKSGTVREINLQGRGLRGVVDAAIWDLAHLEVVNLSENGLSGSVPEWPLAATQPLRSPLIMLNLKHNALVGPLPALEPFVNLRVLAVAGNQLGGAIPAGLSKITRLQSLELGYVRQPWALRCSSPAVPHGAAAYAWLCTQPRHKRAVSRPSIPRRAHGH